MVNNEWTIVEEVSLTNYLIERVISNVDGSLKETCIVDFPHDIYFVGNLRNSNSNSNIDSEVLSKIAPVAFGSDFKVKKEHPVFKIKITLRWVCYFRVFPTFKEQLAFQDRNARSDSQNGNVSDNDDSGGTHSTGNTQDGSSSREALMLKFKKIPCSVEDFIIINATDLSNIRIDADQFKSNIQNEINRARQVVSDDADRFRTSNDVNQKISVPGTAMSSEVNYNTFLTTLSTEIIPNWSWEFNTGVGDITEESFTLTFEFTNTSDNTEATNNVEGYFFETMTEFIFLENNVVPFDIALAPKGFRYNPEMWGKGFNCSVDLASSNPYSFKTTHVPIYSQNRLVTKDKPSAKFSELVSNPITTLENILKAMNEYLQVWDNAREDYKSRVEEWDEKHSLEFEKDYEKFKNEISKFKLGLDLLKKYDDLLFAFKLTNETFKRLDPQKTAWRLFQIVFLVSQIPDIAALSDEVNVTGVNRDQVDIIYFPTGGGKTEAYLSCLIFHCFFDRLRGKTAGVTSWIRFPLRLLTVQQTQRAADIIGMAEIVRCEQKDKRLVGKGITGFAVGYYVGKTSTPNKIIPPRQEDQFDPDWSQANDPDKRQEWKRVIKCPSCKTATVYIDFDADSVRVLHKCSNKNCKFENNIIPVYVVDNEIYRYLPSLIVGTIDKLAVMGNARKFAQLMGKIDGRCADHGYYKTLCCQDNCRDRTKLDTRIPEGISGPTLLIQDELHLLKEGLGTFDSHYETFFQNLKREFGQEESIKIVASSATIEAFERQVNHLYGRGESNANVFPGIGPYIDNSFYSQIESYPQRLFVGIIPHNKTILNTILEMIETYHKELQILQHLNIGESNPYGGALEPGSAPFKNLIDLYSLSLTYFLAGRELNAIRTDLESHVNKNLQSQNFTQLNVSELTGSTSTDDVTKILNKIEQTDVEGNEPTSILATSMVSHGVDINRLNAMIFYGIPRQNAEYIQASSRVGRAHVGIIFDCHHPVRERDQSHYEYYLKYHEFLGLLVEPVAINRWSRFSVERTLPGLFMSVLLQKISNESNEANPNRYYMTDFVRGKISRGELSSDDFIDVLQASYQTQNPKESWERVFNEEINLRVQQFLDQIVGGNEQFVSSVLIPKPLISLRDVDEPIEISLDNLGSQWATRNRT